DGRQPGASLTLCPRLLSRAPSRAPEAGPRIVATLERFTHEGIDLLSWWAETRILQASNTAENVQSPARGAAPA
ncbi:MAG: hypothetical protein L0338_39590, partial [Acidobacteria bacterium]|nr:hypothetical protein [Acidobacteriota bacterium]